MNVMRNLAVLHTPESGAYLGPFQTSMMELFWKNIEPICSQYSLMYPLKTPENLWSK